MVDQQLRQCRLCGYVTVAFEDIAADWSDSVCCAAKDDAEA